MKVRILESVIIVSNLFDKGLSVIFQYKSEIFCQTETNLSQTLKCIEETCTLGLKNPIKYRIDFENGFQKISNPRPAAYLGVIKPRIQVCVTMASSGKGELLY